MTTIVKVAICALAVAAPHAEVDGSHTVTTSKEIGQVGRRLAHAILQGNVEGVLVLVGPDGIPCGDSMIPRKQVEADLRTKGSEINAYLFDPVTFRTKFATIERPISLREFLSGADPVEFQVEFFDNFGAPCVRYVVKERRSQPPVCFRHSRKGWVLDHGLYSCP